MPQAIAFLAFGTTSTAGLTIFGINIAAGSIGGSLLSLAGSLLLSTAANALLAKAPSQPDLKRELAYPSALPQKRHVYGKTRATASPIAYPVRGEYIYGCWLLNSRPSDLPDFTLLFDKREVALTGDAFDFSLSGGATPTEAPFLGHAKIWIGRGDQTSPPAEILADAPWAVGGDEELFKATDGGEGCTVIWCKLNRGDNGTRQERWPSTPPLIEVEGRFSKVWDPRDVAQDPDDPATWAWSETAALCTLDALRNNPFRPYSTRSLMLPLWQDAANFDEESVPLKAGGAEARYRLGGTLVFNGSEIEDIVAPMFQSAAARPVRVGGKLGIVPGVWQAPAATISDLLGDRSFADMKAGRGLPNEMQVTYTAADRGYESAALKPWAIPGATGGLPNIRTMDFTWVTSPQQAMRLRKINGLRAIQQREITGTAPPSAFELIGGATVTGQFPAPYSSIYNGVYEVENIHPGLSPQGEPGGEVALRCPITLVETSADIYAWNAETDEETVEVYTYNSSRAQLDPPGAITTSTGPGVDINTGGTIIPTLKFAFDPSPSARVDRYVWRYRVDGGDWTEGGAIAGDLRDGGGKVFGLIYPASVEVQYDISVQAEASAYERSAASELFGALISFAVTVTTSTAGTAQATFDGTAPAISTASVKIFRSATGAGFGAAVLVFSPVPVATGAAFSITATGLAAGNADFYLAPVSPTGVQGSATAPINLTIA